MTNQEKQIYARGEAAVWAEIMRIYHEAEARHRSLSEAGLSGEHIGPAIEIPREVRKTILTVIDMLGASRHAFRSKQIQEAREMLEKLL